MPKTKQVAIKSSGRGKNTELSSSSAPILDITKSLKKKPLLAERGFSAEEPSAGFISTVTALSWEKFVQHRKEYVATLVREFYEGIVERNDGRPSTVSRVRGEEVRFDARTINDYFGLGYFGKAIETKQKEYGLVEMNEIKDRICVEGAEWERSGEQGTEFKILKKYLCDEANMWFGFVRHSLLPTSHTLFVDKERLIVIDAIMSREFIEVGKLINREINKYKIRKDGNLYFPCLITDLCMDAPVEILAGELREKPKGAFPTKYKAKQRPDNATTSVSSQTLQRLVAQQDSLAKFVREQFEWQKKINAYLTKGKMTVPEPVLPDWMKDDEDEDEVPLSTLHLKAVKKGKAKRMRSPLKEKKSPAKKKQKRSTSEEEELRSSDLDNISDQDAEETKKISMEVLSEEESEDEEAEGKGSSSEATDIQVDSPPTKATGAPSRSAKPRTPPQETNQPQSSPTNPPTKEQIIPETPLSPSPEILIPPPPPTHENPPLEDLNLPTETTNEEPPVETQPPEQPAPVVPSENVVASEHAATALDQPVEAPKKQRIKMVMTKSPFGRRKGRAQTAVTSEGQSEPIGADPAVEEEQPENTEGQRTKLQVRRKQGAGKKKQVTATSGAFIATGQEAADEDVAVADPEDATASAEPEVEKAPVITEATETDAAAEQAKKKALEEAQKRLAEHAAEAAKKASSAPVASTETSVDAVASGDTAVTGAAEEKDKKDKKKKKKDAESSKPPPRQSGRLRSGTMNK